MADPRDRSRAGNPGRRGYGTDDPLYEPVGRTRTDSEGAAPALFSNNRRSGMRNARREEFDAGPTYSPELDHPSLWPERPGKGTVRRLKKGGPVKEGSAKDMREDRKMAKARGLTLKQWEASAADKKHDAPKKSKPKTKAPRR
jgi:hypothetical protein